MSGKILKFRWLSTLLPKSSQRRLVLLTGARQTGKTTLAQQAYPELRYVNLDAPENREAARAVSAEGWARSFGNLILDEAQKEPVVFEKVKYAFDAGTVSFTALLGSSQVLMLKSIRETLAGRAFVYELWPLMPSELQSDAGRGVPPRPLVDSILGGGGLDGVLADAPELTLGEGREHSRNAEAHLLRWGGMPELLSLSDGDRERWLASYGHTYLERDLADLARLGDLQPFRTLQRLASPRTGRLLSYSELARDAGISADTVRRYLEYLSLTYQVILLPPYHRNLTSRVIKAPKLYWVDAGINRSLAGYVGEPTGEHFESYVIAELYKWIRTAQSPASLSFYRTRSGMELDGLIETPRGLLGVEVKSRPEVRAGDARAMREVAAAAGSSWLGGLCVYRGDRLHRLEDPAIWAVPSYRLFS